jgi:hypothetical protein
MFVGVLVAFYRGCQQSGHVEELPTPLGGNLKCPGKLAEGSFVALGDHRWKHDQCTREYLGQAPFTVCKFPHILATLCSCVTVESKTLPICIVRGQCI